MTTPCYNTAQDIGDAADNCNALNEIVAATPSKEEHLLTTPEPAIPAAPVLSLSAATTNVSYKAKPAKAEGIDWEYDIEAWGTDTAVTKVQSGEGSGLAHTDGYWVGIGLVNPDTATKLEFAKNGSGTFTEQSSLDSFTVDSKKGFGVWPNVATATGKTISYLVRWIDSNSKVICTNLYNIHVGEFKLQDAAAAAVASSYAASPASVIAAAPVATVAAVPTETAAETKTTTTSTKKTSTKKTTSTSTKASS